MAFTFIRKSRSAHCAQTDGRQPGAEGAATPSPRVRSRTEGDGQPTLLPFAASPSVHPGPSLSKTTMPDRAVADRHAGAGVSARVEPVQPLEKKMVDKINALAGDTGRKGKHHGAGSSGDRGDPLAPLNISWLVTVGGDLAQGQPAALASPFNAAAGASFRAAGPANQAERGRDRLHRDREAFFRYPGPAGDFAQFSDWVQNHPLHRLFNGVYPMSGMASAFSAQGISTPMHVVLAGNVLDPAGFFISLCMACKQCKSDGLQLVDLFKSAIAVRAGASGVLRQGAEFFSRFFSALIALEIAQEGDRNGSGVQDSFAIAEKLRQSWLDTDFDALLNLQAGTPPASRPQSQAHLQSHGRQEAPGAHQELHGDTGMPPRKKRKFHQFFTPDPLPESEPAVDGTKPAGPGRLPAWKMAQRHASPRRKDDLLADPDFPSAPVREMPVSRAQLSSMSSETEVARGLPGNPIACRQTAVQANAGLPSPVPRLVRKRKWHESAFSAWAKGSGDPDAEDAQSTAPAGRRRPAEQAGEPGALRQRVPDTASSPAAPSPAGRPPAS